MGLIEFPILVAIAFAYQPMQYLLLGALVFVIDVVPFYLRQHFVNKVDRDICFLVHAALYVRYLFFAIWSKYLTPASDQSMASWDFL